MSPRPSPVVATPSGPLRGLTDGEVHSFLGIRYGAPPVGDDRLRPAKRPAPHTEVIDAVRYGPRSIQPASVLAPAGEAESEDCLFLNVWSSSLEGSAPVMVWIHGGSFVTGSGSIAWYDGANLAARGVVVVTLNYRLGALGFLHLESIGGPEWAGSANLGLGDQRLALEWVRDNISCFGGDPDRVTLFGESAGAMSVSSHLGLDSSRPLFHRAIVQSGAARHVQSTETATATARFVIEHLGLDVAEPLSFASVDAGAFAAASSATDQLRGGGDLPLFFRPTVDGSTVPAAPLDAIADGSVGGVELLLGTTSEEMKLFRTLASLAGHTDEIDESRLIRRLTAVAAQWQSDVEPLDLLKRYRTHWGDLSPSELWCAVTTDTVFRMPMIEMADAAVRGGATVRTYVFSHRSTGLGGALGAGHATEIPYVFDNLTKPGTELMLGAIDERRRSFAADLADCWVEFASGQNLRVPGTTEAWPKYDLAERSTVVLDIDSVVEVDRHGDLRTAWLGS